MNMNKNTREQIKQIIDTAKIKEVKDSVETRHKWKKVLMFSKF